MILSSRRVTHPPSITQFSNETSKQRRRVVVDEFNEYTVLISPGSFSIIEFSLAA